MPGGGVAFAAEDPAIGVLDDAGRRGSSSAARSSPAFPAHDDAALKVSRDGARVQFGLVPDGARLVRFSLFARELLPGAATAADLAEALTESPELRARRLAGLAVAGRSTA